MSSGVKLTNRFFNVNGFDSNIVKTNYLTFFGGILSGKFKGLVNLPACLLFSFVILHI